MYSCLKDPIRVAVRAGESWWSAFSYICSYVVKWLTCNSTRLRLLLKREGTCTQAVPVSVSSWGIDAQRDFDAS
jgi:hypothetical protein